MTTAAGTKSEVDVLLKAAKANGYKTVPAQGGHKKIVDHRGKPVIDSKGPIIISGTPGDHRWRDMTVKRWLAAGIIKVDPFESNTPGKAVRRLKGGAVSGRGGGSRLADPDVQEAKVAAIKAKAAVERDHTQKMREQWEPIVAKIGGWGKIGQLSDVVFWFGEWRGIVERFKTRDAAYRALTTLRKGQTLSEAGRKAMAYFIEELVKVKNPQDRYIELVRLSKGLPAKEDETIRGGDPLPDPLPKEVRDQLAVEKNGNGNGSVGRIGPATKPSLALEIVAQMMVGRTEVDDRVLALGEQIQELELRERGFVA